MIGVTYNDSYLDFILKDEASSSFTTKFIAVYVDSLKIMMICNEMFEKFYFGHSQSETKSGTKSEAKSE